MAISQLDATLTAIEARRATSQEAGSTRRGQGSALMRARGEPDRSTTALAHMAALKDRASVPGMLRPRGRWTRAAVTATLIQHPRKAVSSQSRGTVTNDNAASVATKSKRLHALARAGANASASPS